MPNLDINPSVSKFNGNVLSDVEEEKVPQPQKSKDVNMEVDEQQNENYNGNKDFDEEIQQNNFVNNNDMIGARPQGPIMSG